MFSLAQTSTIVVAQAATEVAQQVGEHAEQAGHTASHATPHAINWVTLLAQSVGDTSTLGHLLIQGEKIIFAMIVIALIFVFFFRLSSRMSIFPSKLQVVVESVVLMLDGLVCGSIGSPKARVYTPFAGSLFIYILVSNFFGLFPLQNATTGYITTTAALAFFVFFYLQWIAWTKNGFFGYIYHLAGSPKDVMGYVILPLFFVIHVLGELTKPMTLMFRLYGNIMAGHILVGVFLALGVSMLRPYGVPVGMPLHIPFLFLEVLVCLIQALVFALLVSVYIGSVLPHDEEHDQHHDDLVAEQANEEPAHG